MNDGVSWLVVAPISRDERLHARSCRVIEAMWVLVPYLLRVEGLGAERNMAALTPPLVPSAC